VTASGATGSPAQVTLVQARRKRHIKVASVSATSIAPGSVLVTWQAIAAVDSTGAPEDTASGDNYTFEVQRSPSIAGSFEMTANGVITGNAACPDTQQFTYKDSLAPAGACYYRLKQVDFDGSMSYTQPAEVRVFTGTETPPRIPSTFDLAQNYPNPFNPSTTISFDLPAAATVQLTVYNQLGQEVARLVSGYREAGTHAVVWDASGVASGVYFYRISAGQYTGTRQLILLK